MFLQIKLDWGSMSFIKGLQWESNVQHQQSRQASGPLDQDRDHHPITTKTCKAKGPDHHRVKCTYHPNPNYGMWDDQKTSSLCDIDKIIDVSPTKGAL